MTLVPEGPNQAPLCLCPSLCPQLYCSLSHLPSEATLYLQNIPLSLGDHSNSLQHPTQECHLPGESHIPHHLWLGPRSFIHYPGLQKRVFKQAEVTSWCSRGSSLSRTLQTVAILSPCYQI